MRCRCVIGLFGIVWLSGFAFQQGAMADDTLQVSECSFDKATPVKIVNIDDYGGVSLENGQRVKLADLFFPLSKETGALPSKTFLQMKKMLKGQKIRALMSGPADRYGREPAFLYGKNATGEPYLVQTELIRSSAAVYMPEPQLRKIFVSNCEFDQIKAQLIAIAPKEPTFGKRKRVGFAPVFSAKSQRLWGLEGEFVIVQGVVTEVRRTKRGVSINFGDDWKKDFTAYLSPLVSKTFENNKKLNSNLTGQRIQLRGFLDLYYGPSMRIDHLMQLEMLSE